MSIILNEQKFTIPNIKTVSWLDPEAKALGLKEVSHKSKRNTWLRGIVCHTIHGKLGKLLPGLGPDTTIDIAQARYQTNTTREVSWDFTCDMNGDWLAQNDPLKSYTWQATSVNGYTCGFELVQHDNGDLYEGQIAKAVQFIDFLTAKLGIQRQIPWDMAQNCSPKATVNRIAGGNHGKDVVGIYSHSHQTTNRGYGDCGPWLPIALKNAGYETYAFDGDDDKAIWKARQKAIGIKTGDCDGIPGPATVKALAAAGHKHGIYVSRPIDKFIE
jgi:hypothetical protein